jgi:gliding motility-associated-like protein
MAEITVTADDRKGGVIWTKFWVTVLEASCDGITVSPNPFTPNDDGFNDHVDFKFSRKYTQQPEVLIFNIAGKRVKSLSTANAGILKWQGVDDDGQALEPGVYIYIIKSNGQNISNGTITLMR